MKYILLTFLLYVPFFSRAQEYFGEIDLFIIRVNGFINNILVPFVFTVSLMFFIYGMYKFFIYNGAVSDVEKEKGKDLMLYAVIGFVLMVSIWGIVNLVASGLFTGIGGNAPAPVLPGIPTL